jgi:hypothetical protein
MLRLPDQIPLDQEIASVTARSHGLQANRCQLTDGACDTGKCHDASAERGAVAVIPPRRNATVESCHRRCNRPQRGSASVEVTRSGHLATMVRGQPAIGSTAAPNAATAKAKSKPGCHV